MGVADVVIVISAAVLIAGLGWFFSGPRKARTARLEGGVQRVEVTVRGGYSPDVIKVRQGVPVELVSDRQEGWRSAPGPMLRSRPPTSRV